jgi:hypothetical protein
MSGTLLRYVDVSDCVPYNLSLSLPDLSHVILRISLHELAVPVLEL